jgi:hypothetical protein
LFRPFVKCGFVERILELVLAVPFVRLVYGAGGVRMHRFEQFPEDIILAHALGELRVKRGRAVSRGSARGEFCWKVRKAELRVPRD